MLRIIEESSAFSENKKKLDVRIKEARDNTFKLAENSLEHYPNYEAFENEERRRKVIALEKYGRENYLYTYNSVETYWYYLGKLFSDLKSITEWLEDVVTYIPHKEELSDSFKRLDCIFEYVINEMWELLSEWENVSRKQIEAMETGDFKSQCYFCIGEFQDFISVICRIIRENEVDHFYF